MSFIKIYIYINDMDIIKTDVNCNMDDCHSPLNLCYIIRLFLKIYGVYCNSNFDSIIVMLCPYRSFFKSNAILIYCYFTC
jgi:hypothetical protein